MKRKLITLLLFFASLSLVFVSCNKNDDEGTDHAAAIAGTYSGSLSIAGEPIQEMTSIELKRSSNSKVKIILTDFSLGNINLGKIEADKVPVTENGGKYTLEETTTTIALPVSEIMPELALIGITSVPVPVKVSGTVSGNTLNLTIAVASEQLQLEMNVDFAGDKK